jgi:hypothetical protein
LVIAFADIGEPVLAIVRACSTVISPKRPMAGLRRCPLAAKATMNIEGILAVSFGYAGLRLLLSRT